MTENARLAAQLLPILIPGVGVSLALASLFYAVAGPGKPAPDLETAPVKP